VSAWTCRCKPRCQSLGDCHAPVKEQRAILCDGCGDEEVSALGQLCAECADVMGKCRDCGRDLDENERCLDCAATDYPYDTREEARGER
jgi:hypothetical protein